MRITNRAPRACICEVSITTRVVTPNRNVFVMVVSRPLGSVREVLLKLSELATVVTCEAGTVYKLASASPTMSCAELFTKCELTSSAAPAASLSATPAGKVKSLDCVCVPAKNTWYSMGTTVLKLYVPLASRRSRTASRAGITNDGVLAAKEYSTK